jgi:hypothetical protein
VKITGTDGAGASFERITDNTGTVVISGSPGIWSFSGSKDGYEPGSWGNNAYTTRRHDAYLQKSTVTAVKTAPNVDTIEVLLYMYEGSLSGFPLSSVSISGIDGNGAALSAITDSSGKISLSGDPGTWQFSASKAGYDSSTWTNHITGSKTLKGYLTKIQDTTIPPVQNTAQVILVMYNGPTSGSPLSGILITGQDGKGNAFSETTDSTGSVTLSGAQGTWQFSAAKIGYESAKWSNTIVGSQQLKGYLITSPAELQPGAQINIKVTLVMRDGSASGPVLSGIAVTGQDGSGTQFSQVTDSSGTVALSGAPGTWQFSASKAGYDSSSWSNEITSGTNLKGFLVASEGTKTEQIAAGTIGSKYLVIPYFAQNNPTWTGDTLGTGTGTLGGYGCAVTSAAMVLTAYEIDNKNPRELNQWLIKNHGFKLGQGKAPDNEWDHINWYKVAEASGNTITLKSVGSASLEMINGYIDSGYPVIAQVTYKQDCIRGSNSDSPHFIVITGYIENQDGITYKIHDPFDNPGGNKCGVKGNATTLPDPEGRFRIINDKSGAEGYITQIIVYQGPITSILSSKNTQTQQSTQSISTVSQFRSSSATLLEQFLSVLFPASKTQIPEVSTVQSETMLEQSTSSPEGNRQVSTVQKLGYVSAKYESAGDPAAISSGSGDFGGKSYGTYQLSSETGTLNQFLQTSEYSDDFEGLEIGSEKFDDKWRTLSENDDFINAQYNFIKLTHYDIQRALLKNNNLDLSGKGSAVQEAIWSTATQYGPNSNVIVKALKDSNVNSMTDSQIVEKIYKYKMNNIESYFMSSSQEVRNSIKKRFIGELEMLKDISSSEEQYVNSEDSTTLKDISSTSITYYTPPGKPHPLSPGQEYEPGEKVYTTTPTFTWKADTKAQYYSLAISKSPYGSDNLVYNKQEITGSSITIPENVLVAGEKYRWNMYAYNSAGRSPVSWTLYFTVT